MKRQIASNQNGIHEPTYLGLLRSGVLKKRVEQAYRLLTICHVCAWQCNVDRRRPSGKPRSRGVCRTGLKARISSYSPHHGEEDVLRGWRGSGTIFFTACNLRCQYCQNHDISQTTAGREVEPEELASIMLELQDLGCHNINFVSPSHVAPQIMAALHIAAQRGLRLPLVYNTGGYDSLKMLRLLDGLIDIYMPDMKYASENVARRYSRVIEYPTINQTAVQEMYRQVGDLVVNDLGLAVRGLLVRHLVLPNDLAGTGDVLRFLAEDLSTDTYLNLMPQYRPSYMASRYPEIDRPLSYEEYGEAQNQAQVSGLHHIDNRTDG
ncbi:radical SAM protein [Candidatus Neomarinimicrobiota bacterium]